MRLCSHQSPERAIAKPIVWLLVACLPLACAADQTTAAGNEAATTESAADAPEDATEDAAEDATEDAAEDASAGGEKFYDVDCNQVDESGNKFCLTDKSTYVGWRTFHSTCHACHGQNAVGSSFAPSLLKHIDKARFVDVVTNGFSGQIGVMPAWGENPNVKDFIDELYAYQQARADGVLKPGRPKRKD